MMSLSYKYNYDIESAYIITIKGNETSERLSSECQQSCKDIDMPFTVWDAYDGTSGVIKVPSHSADSDIMSLIKVTDHYLTVGEVACALSHISLWAYSAKNDVPIVILEHDAKMIKPFREHGAVNSIIYLGGEEQYRHGWKVLPIPPHATDGPNYHFICRAHAYSIDSIMAKNLIAHVVKYGICSSLDMMLRADVFNITQHGLYAYDFIEDKDAHTTILNRPASGRNTDMVERYDVTYNY